MIHELKTWPEFYEQVASGAKTFEARKDDRGFRVGDVLCLREWSPVTQAYSGRAYYAGVTYLLTGEPFGVLPGFVVMSLGAVPWAYQDAVRIHKRTIGARVA